VSLNALITDARQRQALAAVRELGAAGITTCAVASDPQSPSFLSRWCAAHATVPDVALGRDAFVDALLGMCSSYRPEVLIPSHDGTIEALRRHRSRVERTVALALAPEEKLSVAVEKSRTLTQATRLGLRIPRGVHVVAPDEAESALREVGLPAVIKPSRSWTQAGVADADQPAAAVAPAGRLSSRCVRTRSDGLKAIKSILADGVSVLVQEWLPGDREALSFIYAHGRMWARFAQRADRTIPPLGGNSVARESIALPPDITPAAEQLIGELGLDGYSEVEFRRDAEGRAALMEINPRLSASVEIAMRAGVPFALLLYKWASGQQLQEVTGYRVGLRMRWMGGDLAWLRNAMDFQGHPDVPSRGRAFRIFFEDFLHPTSYDSIDRRDPRPALGAGFEAAGDVSRRIRHRSYDQQEGQRQLSPDRWTHPRLHGVLFGTLQTRPRRRRRRRILRQPRRRTRLERAAEAR
jgi:predicted ATP-grasp superfamily ATP-dependent carboligase